MTRARSLWWIVDPNPKRGLVVVVACLDLIGFKIIVDLIGGEEGPTGEEVINAVAEAATGTTIDGVIGTIRTLLSRMLLF
jgi:hypothetical protein